MHATDHMSTARPYSELKQSSSGARYQRVVTFVCAWSSSSFEGGPAHTRDSPKSHTLRSQWYGGVRRRARVQGAARGCTGVHGGVRADLEIAVAVDQDVARLEVAVHDLHAGTRRHLMLSALRRAARRPAEALSAPG